VVRSVSSRSIIGREGPLRALDGLLADASGGRPRIAVLAGEAGVGKTRLVTAMEDGARERGFVVLHGESIEFGGDGFAYAPVASALQDLPRDWTVEVMRTATAETRAALGGLVPAVDHAERRVTAGRRCILLTDLLGRLAEDEAPVLLVLEDVHWADRSSREFIAYLARNLRAQRLACALTIRTGELAAGHPLRRLVAELARRPAITHLELPPLTEDQVGRQLEAIAGGPVPASLSAAIHARAGGNPFLVEELFAAQRGGDRVPTTLAEAMLMRLAGLDAGTLRVLAFVAAAGGRIDHDLLARVFDAGGPLHAALDAGILVRDRDDRGVAFRHGLMGEVVYGQLLPAERRELHRAIAEGLGDGAPSRLAHHWHRAGEPRQALAASVTAGLEAAGMFAFAEAQTHLERALELWDEVRPAPESLPVDHVGLLSRAAEAARFSGDRERAIALGRQALANIDAAADPARAARLFERLGEAHYWDDEAALDWYGQALALLPDRPTPERARLLAAEGHALMGLRRWAEARDRCEAALATGAREADTGARTTLGLVLGFLGEPDEGEAHLRAALAHARGNGAGDAAARAYINLGELLRLRGDHAAALAAMDEGNTFVSRLGMRGSFGQFMYVNGADDLFRLGRWDEVAARLGEAERMPLGLTTEAMYRAIAVHLHALRGDTTAARRHFERALAIVDGLPSEFVTPAASAGAVLALVERSPDEARERVETALATLAAKDPLYTPPLLSHGVRAEADIAADSRARRRTDAEGEAVVRAEALTRELEGIAGGDPVRAHVALARAELARARGEPAAGLWGAAAARFDALREPHHAAYARLRHAEAGLAAGGGRQEAARIVTAVVRVAVELGAAPLRQEAETLARMGRLVLDVAEPVAPPDDGPAGLTSREAEVLALLANGLTNREIGSRLFITSKTVGTHVAHIFEKLDVHSRVEAAGRARGLGLVP
jgi:ATP/maltotriose-dependent transcriptional regulator MalT